MTIEFVSKEVKIETFSFTSQVSDDCSPYKVGTVQSQFVCSSERCDEIKQAIQLSEVTQQISSSITGVVGVKVTADGDTIT